MTIQLLLASVVKIIEQHPIASALVWAGSVLTSVLAQAKPILQIAALALGIVVAVLTAMNRWQEYQIQKAERALQQKALKGIIRRVKAEFEDNSKENGRLTRKEEEIIEDLKQELDFDYDG
jgi:HAMP domain-containing protein